MKLYNQTRQALRFDTADGSLVINWEPYGAANVPDSLVLSLKEQRFPVDVTPVAPVVRAAVVADEAASAQRGDEVEKLKAEVSGAKGEASVAKKTAEDALGKVAGLEDAAKAAEAKAADQSQRAEGLSSDCKALEAKLADTAKKLESTEARALAAEAERDQLKSDIEKLTAPPADKTPPKK